MECHNVHLSFFYRILDKLGNTFLGEKKNGETKKKDRIINMCSEK